MFYRSILNKTEDTVKSFLPINIKKYYNDDENIGVDFENMHDVLSCVDRSI